MKKADIILLGLMTLLCILLITNEITVMLERFVQSEELPIAAEDQQNSIFPFSAFAKRELSLIYCALRNCSVFCTTTFQELITVGISGQT